MEYRRLGKRIILRVQRGEQIMEQIAAVCEKENILAAEITGIGACDRARASVFCDPQAGYHTNEWNEPLELASLTGNATRRAGAPHVHCHAVFCRKDGTAVGGHLEDARVAGTAEIFLHLLQNEIGRRADSETGLQLMEFSF